MTDDGLPVPPGSLSYAWSQVSGPGTVTFANAAAADTSATFSAAGVYVVRLTASDGALSNFADATITVNPAPPVNTAPVVSAGADQPSLVLGAIAVLDGTVTDDGLPVPPGSLSYAWSQVSGPGTVTFGNAAAADTSATFSAAGVYVVRLTASDGALEEFDDATIIVSDAESVIQVNDFLTGYKGPDLEADQLTVPSTDPAGITYHPPSGHLFIVDSEINEDDLVGVLADAGGNVFETSLDGGTLYNVYDITGLDCGEEPTGIAYDPNDDVFYVTNDDAQQLCRFQFTSGVGFSFLDSVGTDSLGGFNDPEGVTVDAAGSIYVIDQLSNKVGIYAYASGFTLTDTLDLEALNPSSTLPNGPEGIAYDPDTGHLFFISKHDLPYAIFEYTIDGDFVDRYDIGGFTPTYSTFPRNDPYHDLDAINGPQGIAFGPGSGSSTPPSFYLTDGGIDNNDEALERDGVVYEGRLG